MYFKSDYHEELYIQYIDQLQSEDVYYGSFAYLAAAIGKKSIIKALSDHSIDVGMLEEMADVWSSSERAMLEMAWQCFTGRNFFEDKDGEVRFPTLDHILYSLDKENTKIVIEALATKYL